MRVVEVAAGQLQQRVAVSDVVQADRAGVAKVAGSRVPTLQ